MTVRLLGGREVASHLRRDLTTRVQRLGDTPPRLAIVRDGSSDAATMYAASLERAAGRIGLRSESIVADAGHTELIEGLNADPSVAGIVVAWPFADADADRELVEHIDPAKDVDGATPTNAGRLARGEPAFVPATALSVIAMIEAFGIEVAGQRVVVVGRSAVVGRPVANLLLARDATVVICHRATRDLATETRRAEVLVVAAGVPRLIGAEMVGSGAVVIDCGINAADGRVVGDVDFEAVAPIAGAITPVPGGIGPVTPMMVLRQTVESAERIDSAAAANAGSVA
jgi:methylenetetrahydrofolate dehydrogenase (NADP+) / methenyltetrahydrofolate cyclohydrolase